MFCYWEEKLSSMTSAFEDIRLKKIGVSILNRRVKHCTLCFLNMDSEIQRLDQVLLQMFCFYWKDVNILLEDDLNSHSSSLFSSRSHILVVFNSHSLSF